MQTQTIQTQPQPTPIVQTPNFNSNDPFWVIIALIVLVKVLINYQPPSK